MLGGLAMERDGQLLTGAAARRRPLALLALLADAGKHGLTRDKAVAYLWPEGNTERSRHALAQTLYSIRHDLGPDVLIAGSNDLRLNPALIEIDLWEFEKALGAGDQERAAALYAGPFLDGFYVNDAPDFERWADEQRARYAHRFRLLLEELAKCARASGDMQGSVEWWRRVVAADPLDARAAVAYMTALAAAGDRAAALRHARVHESLVKQEFRLPADETVQKLTRQLREELESRGSAVVTKDATAATVAKPSSTPAPTRPEALSPASSEADGHRSTPIRMLRRSAQMLATPGPPAATARTVWSRSDRRRSLVGGSLLIASLLAVLFLVRHRTSQAQDRAILAVGTITDYGGSDSSGIARALQELLTTNLARVPGAQIITSARLYDFMGAASSGATAEQKIESAARRAGASELVDGSLYQQAGKPMRLDIRRIDLATGSVRGAYSVQGRDLFGLVDSATALLARDFDAHLGVLSIAEVTTTSLIAHRFYDEGLRALYEHNDPTGALRLFELALREDSSFAMAAYYVYVTAEPMNVGPPIATAVLALRRSGHASDRERLLINAGLRVHFNDPAGPIYAESLLRRFPSDPEGFRILAMANIESGKFLDAIPLLRRVIALDSTSLSHESAARGRRCSPCEAYYAMIEAYWRADSLAAAERVAREYLARRPWSAGAIERLGTVYEYEGRFADAERELSGASDSSSGAAFDPLRRAELYMRWGRFAQADQILEALVAGQDDAAPVRGGALWWLFHERRNEGRLRDAERTIRRSLAVRPGALDANEGLGQVLFEQGRYSEAAAVFDSLLAAPPLWPAELMPRNARQRSWFLGHLATVVAAEGDKVRLARLADSLQMIGERSAYGRDRVLHHYARGLLYRLQGKEDAAIEELRQAIYSPTVGYTRVHYQLGQALLARGRAREAVEIVRPALFGSLESSNGYITRTELHELLARAFETLGQRDSAATHYRSVVDAWSHADPAFHERFLTASKRLSELRRRTTLR